MRWIVGLLMVASSAQADAVDAVAQATQAAFAHMPKVVRVGQIAGVCGADETVNRQVVYCTSRNEIFITREAASLAQAPYLVAHAYGHAVQVQHGIADIALREIRSRRGEEVMLRGMVARQVDCIAGFVVQRAGMRVDVNALFDAEPFAGVHWGRDPLRVGPVVSVGLGARADWFARGQAGDIAACAPGEFTADLLIAALRP